MGHERATFLSFTYLHRVMEASWKFHGSVMELSRKRHGSVMEALWTCHGSVMDVPWKRHGSVMEAPWKLPSPARRSDSDKDKFPESIRASMVATLSPRFCCQF